MTEIQTCGKPIDSLLEKVLCMNILSSDYFKELYRLKTYHEVIDEIYNQVDHVEPWMTGNCRGPSTAFCLLYKFFTMKLTVKQMHGLLKHPDSPYIRAVSRDSAFTYCSWALVLTGNWLMVLWIIYFSLCYWFWWDTSNLSIVQMQEWFSYRFIVEDLYLFVYLCLCKCVDNLEVK